MHSDNTSLSTFLSGLLSTGLGKVVVVSSGLLSLAISTRLVAPPTIGAWLLIGAVTSFMAEFTAMGTNLGLPRFLVSAVTASEKQLLVDTTVSFRFASAATSGLVAVLFAKPFFRWMDIELDLVVVLLVPILIILQSGTSLVQALLQGEFRFDRILQINATTGLVNLFGVAFFVGVLRMDLLGLVVARAVSSTLAISWGFYGCGWRPRARLSVRILKKLLRFGTPLQLNFLMSFAFSWLDVVLVGLLLGPASVAVYGVAKRVPNALGEGYDAFIQVFFPFVSKHWEDGRREDAANLLNTSLRWTLVGVLLCTTITTVWGAQLLGLLFSQSYAEGAPILILLMVRLSLVVLDSTMGYTLVALGHGAKIPGLNLARTVVLFACYWALIPRFGLVGAASAGVVSLTVVLPAVVALLKRAELSTNWRPLLLSYLIFGVVVIVALVVLPGNPIWNVVSPVLFTSLVFAFSIVRKPELTAAMDSGLRRLRVKP